MASTAREENAYTLGVQAGLWGYPLVHRVKAFPQTLLLGRIRDLEAEWTQDAVEWITTENATLKQRVRQLSTDNRTLEERLTAPPVRPAVPRPSNCRPRSAAERATQNLPKRQFSIRNVRKPFDLRTRIR